MNRVTKVNLLQENYERLKAGKGKWLDKRVAYMIAQMITLEDKQYSDSDYRQLDQALKNELGAFHLLSQPVRSMILGMFLARTNSTTTVIPTLLSDYQRLRNVGFNLSSYSYFAAYVLSYSETAEKELIIKKAYDIFKEMKSNHFFLTGPEDGVTAVSLAQSRLLEEQSAEQIAILVEQYYRTFNDNGFYKSDELQFAAALAAQLTGKFSAELILRIPKIIEALKQLGIRFKAEFYTSVVTLAFLDMTTPLTIDSIEEYLALIAEKTHLRFYKEMRQLLALNLYITEQMHASKDYIDVSALTLSIMLAQEQAMIASAIIVSTTAANSSNS
ncbi:DUF4003 family protein [Enterococcus sp. UD-01]|uniref:DUF4003 family protein n=1 Tax=Enterococcus sp. UD-01 TaxID=3373911 RepID=UPI0038364811